jgi:hypothetical protein
MVGMGAAVERGWGPLAMLAGLIAGQVVLHLAVRPERDHLTVDRGALPIVPARAIAGARSDEHDRAAPRERTKAPTAQLAPVPVHLRGKIKFATLSGEVTRAGIDARREDGAAVLVMWRDVVGIVARRLPPEYGAAPFVDLVSTAGSTLRILPWTRLSGDPVGGEGDGRVKVLVGLLAERCPEAQFDPATKAYFGGTQPPAQLPDLATLDAHDQRLA